MDEGRGKNGDKGERGETRESFASGNGDSGHREGRAGEGKRREFSNRRRTKIICGIRFPRGNRVSIGSCEIPGVLTRAIYHARSVFAYVVKGPCVAYALGHIGVVECLLKFACLRILRARAHTSLFSLSLSSLRVSPYLFISASALTSSHPRREKSPSSLLLLLLEFSIVPLNFVPRLSRLAIEVFCGLSFISKRLLPAFPLLPLWRANRQRWSNRQVCSFWIAKRMYFGGEGGRVRRCSWQTMRDIWTHGIYIYIRICGEEVGSPRGRGTWSRRAMRDHRGWTRLFSSVELARRRERSEKGWIPRGTTMRSGVKRWRGLYLEAKGTYWIELNDAYGEIRSLGACDVSSIGA